MLQALPHRSILSVPIVPSSIVSSDYIARPSRSPLPCSQVVAALYKGVVRIAFEVSMTDSALEVLKEMEDAGGELAPDSSRYALMLDLLAKVCGMLNRLAE